MELRSEKTGTRDRDFDLVSLLYHQLEGAATYSRYADDARDAGDEESRTFFARARDSARSMAEEAKRLLKARL